MSMLIEAVKKKIGALRIKPPKRLGCLVYVPAIFTLFTTIIFVCESRI